jgi:hypothetical protein
LEAAALDVCNGCGTMDRHLAAWMLAPAHMAIARHFSAAIHFYRIDPSRRSSFHATASSKNPLVGV